MAKTKVAMSKVPPKEKKKEKKKKKDSVRTKVA